MAKAEKTRVAIDLFTRKGERGELVRMVCWSAEMSEVRVWTLIERIRGVLSEQAEGRFLDGTISQEQEETRLRGSAA